MRITYRVSERAKTKLKTKQKGEQGNMYVLLHVFALLSTNHHSVHWDTPTLTESAELSYDKEESLHPTPRLAFFFLGLCIVPSLTPPIISATV